MTLFALRTPDDLLSVRFACSPLWETQAAVRTFAVEHARSRHEPWHALVRERAARLDLAPLLALQPLRGFVPDFLTPPPRTPRPRLREQLAEVRATPPAQVARELERCRGWVTDERYLTLIDGLLAEPVRGPRSPRRPAAGGVDRARRALLGPHPRAARTRRRAAVADACPARLASRARRAPSADSLDEARALVRRPERPDGGARRARPRADAECVPRSEGRGDRGRAVAADDRVPGTRDRPAVAHDARRARPQRSRVCSAARGRSCSRASTSRCRRRRSQR